MAKIIGVLSWFDESPTWLAATVASLARVCDHIIAVDGRYELYDDDRVVSEMVQHDAVQHTARGAGIGLTMMIPNMPWRDEMHKRTACFELAQQVGAAHEDWVLVCDGDEVVVSTPDKDHLKAKLDVAAEAGARVGSVLFREVADPHENPNRTEIGMKLSVVSAVQCRVPRFFRLGENMRVENYHYNYIAEDVDGSLIEYWGDDSVVEHRAQWTMLDEFVLEHRGAQRAMVRAAAREKYYQDRNDAGLESIIANRELING